MCQQQNSVLKFKNISYVVGKTKKTILSNISGHVTSGQMLSIMGPSGAGKTSLLKALSLSISSGQLYGSVKLNGKGLTSQIFKEDCYLVEQYDHHWPFLTCKETLIFAAELFLGPGNHNGAVEDIIEKMGLESCKNTKVGNEFIQGLSGGQKRRLSIGIALLKRPSVILLDEPTSGLDAAGTVAVVRVLRRIAKEDNLIIVATIHQPSTKVYNLFDQTMLLSQGKQAYMGKADSAMEYFLSIGYHSDEMINPAEFLLDLVNADFSSDEEVNKILEVWNSSKEVGKNKRSKKSIQDSIDHSSRKDIDVQTSNMNQFFTLSRRHLLMIRRDPFLYIGRALTILVSNIVIAFVYWNSRERTQDQAWNFINANSFFFTIGSLLAVVSVFELNNEYKSVKREIKNGMINPLMYISAKSLLVIPVMFVFAFCGLTISSYGILKTKLGYIVYIIIYAISVFIFECFAEFFSVIYENPLIGMVQFLGLWFGSFLFAGLFIPSRDIPVMVRWLYHVLPFAPMNAAMSYHIIYDQDWENCDPSTNLGLICVDLDQYPEEKSGLLLLESLNRVSEVFSAKDKRLENMIVLLIMSLFFKSLYTLYIMYDSSRETRFLSKRLYFERKRQMSFRLPV